MRAAYDTVQPIIQEMFDRYGTGLTFPGFEAIVKSSVRALKFYEEELGEDPYGRRQKLEKKASDRESSEEKDAFQDRVYKERLCQLGLSGKPLYPR